MIIRKIRFYINKLKKREIKRKYNFENNIDNNINPPKKKELKEKFYQFKKTDAYIKKREKIINKMKQTEIEVNKIKKYRERIAENIDIMNKFLKENKDIRIKEKKVIDSYLKFCIYYINNFKNLKILKILDLFLNYTMQVYIQNREINNLDKFKKQIKKSIELIDKKIEAKSIFNNLNIVNFSINNFLLQNRNLLNDIDKRDDVRKDVDKLNKINERRKRLRERKEKVEEIGDDINKAKSILERIKNINKKFDD